MSTASVRYGDYLLHSFFQPILSLCHRRSVGFESLLRAMDREHRWRSPRGVMREAAARGDIRRLDALCQNLHIANFSAQSVPERWLFLNLDPSTITDRWYHDGTLLEALTATGISPSQLVIEIVESEITDEPQLYAAIDYIRSIGALVALDDFGAGHSNFDRIWRLAPDIIKLDRSLIVEAEQHRTGRLRQILPNLVSLIHEAGSLVLAEGIENRDQALLAMDADIDFVQGFYFGRPSDTIDNAPQTTLMVLDGISRDFLAAARIEEQLENDRIAPYVAAFREVLERLARGVAPAQAARRLIAMPRAARFYLLDRAGEEVARVEAPVPAANKTFLPLPPMRETAGGIWYRRQYFRAAITEPQRLQISRPYLSSTGGYMCVTLSLARGRPPQDVVCCDIAW